MLSITNGSQHSGKQNNRRTTKRTHPWDDIFFSMRGAPSCWQNGHLKAILCCFCFTVAICGSFCCLTVEFYKRFVYHLHIQTESEHPAVGLLLCSVFPSVNIRSSEFLPVLPKKIASRFKEQGVHARRAYLLHGGRSALCGRPKQILNRSDFLRPMAH